MPTIDYSKRLVSLSWHFLSAEECELRNKADIEPAFNLYKFPDSQARSGYPNYENWEMGKHSFSDAAGADHELLDCLQIDLLRPVYDYLTLKYNSLLFLLIDVERELVRLLRDHGINPGWTMIGCTTRDDSSVSALRRTLVFPNVGLNGEKVENLPRCADLPLPLIHELEQKLEEFFWERAPIEHYK